MNNPSDGISIGKVQMTNVMLLFSLTLSAWIAFSGRVALSVLIGGAIATLSFFWLKKDVHQLFNGPLQTVKFLFFLKYYGRLAVLALFLYWLLKNDRVDVFGLVAGLSTVVVSIVITALGAMKKVHSPVKEVL